VDPITVSVTIARPREEVFEYLADVANHPEFTDHFLKDWRLTREDSYGRGAGARFRVDSRANRFGWADKTLVEVEPPFRIVEKGRGGKFNRIRSIGVYTLTPGAAGTTKVELTYETEPPLITDRIMESFGRGWYRRRSARALRRLRSILEDDRERGRRATIAAR
jgi:uncharacterized protein YndB with AHSA1/START domain